MSQDKDIDWQKQIADGQRVQLALEDPAVQHAFRSVYERHAAISVMGNTIEEREEARARARMVNEILEEMRGITNAGKLASQKMDDAVANEPDRIAAEFEERKKDAGYG